MMRYASWLMAPILAAALAGPAAAEAVPVRVDRAACSRVVAHVPDPGVEYRPGVDVNGKPVAPADLADTPQLTLPDEIVLTLELDLARFDGRTVRTGVLVPNVQLGLITVEGNRVFYNGQPLDDPEQARLVAACREFLKRRR